MTLQKLNGDLLNQGWEIIEHRFYKLREKGIDQYPSLEYLRETFEKTIVEGTPFGLVVQSKLIGMFVLTSQKIDPRWEWDTNTPFLWLSAFFTDPSVSGQEIGAKLLLEAKRYAVQNLYESIVLDCYCDGNFLESYYQNQGFKTIKTTRFTFRERSFTAALLQWNRKSQ